jgi:twitching motility two-component system response regulator PilH
MSQRIVVVDNSRTVCGVVEWAYHGSGIEVLPALTGGEALALIRRSPPVAVIVSYALPDMEAAAFCAALRGDAAAGKVPILLLTGGYHAVDVAAVLGAGADDALGKPFRSSELLSKVQGVREVGAARGYFAGVRPAAPPPLRPAVSPPPLHAPPPPPAAGLVIAPPPVLGSPLIAPPPAAPLIAPPAALIGGATAVSAAFTAPPSAVHPAVAAAAAFAAPSGSPSSGMHRAAPPPSGLRTEEREALLRALQPVVLEQVKGALPAIVREVLPAMLREVLATVMREQLGAKVEEYSKRRVDEYVERELPQAADAAIERYLQRIGEGDGQT